MNNCTGCGAQVQSGIQACPYCGAAMPVPMWQQQQQHALQQQQLHYEQARHANAQFQSQAAVDSSASTAFIVSLLGLVFCCIPILPFVGLILSIRSRGMAKKQNLPAPGKATAGLVISICSIAFLGLAVVIGIVEQKQVEERIATLETQLDGQLEEPELSHDVACKLAELYLLEGNYESISETAADEVSCNGKVVQEGELAEMAEIRVSTSYESNDVVACYRKGQKWYVDHMSSWAGDCGIGGEALELDAAAAAAVAEAVGGEAPAGTSP